MPSAVGSNGHALVEAALASYGQQGGASRGAGEPMQTVTASPKDQNQVVTASLLATYYGKKGSEGPADARTASLADPLATATTANRHSLVSAEGVIVRTDNTSGDPTRKGIHSPAEPLRTASTAGGFAVAVPFLVPRYGERPAAGMSPGQTPRSTAADRSFGTITPTANCGSLATVELGGTGRAAFVTSQYGCSIGRAMADPAPAGTAVNKTGLICAEAAIVVKMNHGSTPFYGPGTPLHTAVTGGTQSLVRYAFVAQHNTGKTGARPDVPMSTVMAAGVRQSPVVAEAAVVGAGFMAQMNTGLVGHACDIPFSTFVGKGCTQVPVAVSMASAASHRGRPGAAVSAAFTAAYVVSMKGSERRMSGAGDPLPAACAGGNHTGAVAMMMSYFGVLQRPDVLGPMPTATARRRFAIAEGETGDRYGLTGEQARKAKRVADFLREHGCWDGGDVVIVDDKALLDIALRMLTPRELANGQGFPRDYVLDPVYNGKKLTATTMTRLVGNSVCPDVAAALAHSNMVEAVGLGKTTTPYRPWGEEGYFRISHAAAQRRLSHVSPGEDGEGAAPKRRGSTVKGDRTIASEARRPRRSAAA